ncbi:hypothetical protein HYT18_00285 [Candidatus Microgenomates bacterium]|nr:hypothetical protein [Candidatus Microgenomates bacterium]
MAKIELVYPQSPTTKLETPINFQMDVKDGPYEEDLPDDRFRQQLREIRTTPPNKTAFLVGAMNKYMDSQTRRMVKEARELIETVDRALVDYNYRCFHCFGLQDYGKYRVTSSQATLRDGILVRRSNIFIALDTAPESSNAQTEILYRLDQGGSLIALFREDNLRPEYRGWLEEQVASRLSTNPSAVILTYRNLDDLKEEICKIADLRYPFLRQ